MHTHSTAADAPGINPPAKARRRATLALAAEMPRWAQAVKTSGAKLD